MELGDYSSFKLYPLSESLGSAPELTIREKRSTVHVVRQRSARAVHFQDELGGVLDQVRFLMDGEQ